MTRTERIKKAVELLAPPGDRRASCKRALQQAIGAIETKDKISAFEKRLRSAQGKKALTKAQFQLRKVAGERVKCIDELVNEAKEHRTRSIERLAVEQAAILLV